VHTCAASGLIDELCMMMTTMSDDGVIVSLRLNNVLDTNKLIHLAGRIYQLEHGPRSLNRFSPSTILETCLQWSVLCTQVLMVYTGCELQPNDHSISIGSEKYQCQFHILLIYPWKYHRVGVCCPSHTFTIPLPIQPSRPLDRAFKFARLCSQ